MGMANLIKALLIERDMTMTDMAENWGHLFRISAKNYAGIIFLKKSCKRLRRFVMLRFLAVLYEMIPEKKSNELRGKPF